MKRGVFSTRLGSVRKTDQREAHHQHRALPTPDSSTNPTTSIVGPSSQSKSIRCSTAAASSRSSRISNDSVTPQHHGPTRSGNEAHKTPAVHAFIEESTDTEASDSSSSPCERPVQGYQQHKKRRVAPFYSDDSGEEEQVAALVLKLKQAYSWRQQQLYMESVSRQAVLQLGREIWEKRTPLTLMPSPISSALSRSTFSSRCRQGFAWWDTTFDRCWQFGSRAAQDPVRALCTTAAGPQVERRHHDVFPLSTVLFRTTVPASRAAPTSRWTSKCGCRSGSSSGDGAVHSVATAGTGLDAAWLGGRVRRCQLGSRGAGGARHSALSVQR